ncbi:MAG: two-component system activity regulator YycH [Lactobacillus sp.]|nr:two-component system activity regulator YycH [Lactobacillus sp.]MCH3905710.1 two-component system activity regulator YycH [Lactobacillus sp.]MCH3990721.1 two-component system activity regulator YycH [Lactobacillus sp.]MCH4068563.1 two-component system activity regulator YycH [Lactobacillus sp.]MCI1304142.1 two-component system activity regulator YycH [Lactobacillus sp.]
MKFKRTLTATVMGIALVALVVLSLVLSIFIWTNDERFTQLSPDSDSSSSYHRTVKGLHNLFMPTQVFAYRDGHFYQVNDTKSNLPLEFSKEYAKRDTGSPILVSSTKTAYEKKLHKTNYVQLTFPDQVSFGAIDNHFKRNKTREFNRIFVDHHRIYAGNDRNYALYRLPDQKQHFKKLRKLVKQAKQVVPVHLRRLNHYYLVVHQRSHSLHVYSYLINQQSDSYFSSRLLGTSSVARHSHNGTTTYNLNGGVYQRLSVTQATHNYHYFNYYEGRKVKKTYRQLTDSVYFVNQVGLMNQDLRFFEKDGSRVCYQNFIEGVPVFVQNRYEAQIAVDYSSHGLNVYFNSTDLQIPIPVAGQMQTLPATQTILDQLQGAGVNLHHLQGLTIGYSINQDSSHEKLVNLVPAYYAKINHHWQPVSELLTLRQQNQIEAQ